MFQGLRKDQLEGALEALLFVTDEPVGALRLAEMLYVDVVEVEAALDRLQESLASGNRGVQLREVAGGWRMYTHPAYHELIEQYVISWDTRKLSAAALETLAIVAYTQPATRASISGIRGVNSDSSVNSLVEKGLLREAGVLDAPGNPVLYATSSSFLEKFGLRSVADLPPLDDFAPDEETRELIRERLSARRVADGEIFGGDAPEGQASPLDDVVFEVEDEEELSVGPLAEAAAALALELDRGFGEGEEDAPTGPEDGSAFSVPAGSLMARALASASGAVEKIDFDSLVFEGDDDE